MTKIILAIAIFLNINLLANQELNKDCQDGKMQSCIELGILYSTGESIEKNMKKSRQLFKKACKNRVSRGCYYLGFIYLRGAEGIAKNEKKAMGSFARGCNIGSERSCVQYRLLKNKGH